MPPSARRWSKEDEALLARVRQAQALGAIDLLKEDVGSLQGYTVLYKIDGERIRLLTKAGYEKYAFFRSQRARKYFEDEGLDTRSAFELKTIQGERLFDAQGMLTMAGDDLYNRILQKQTVRWLDPFGQEMSNSPFLPSSGTVGH